MSDMFGEYQGGLRDLRDPFLICSGLFVIGFARSMVCVIIAAALGESDHSILVPHGVPRNPCVDA